jgi:hypothetical protein
MEKGPYGLEIEVDDAVGLGQKARRLGRSFGTKKNGEGEQQDYSGYYQQRSARALMHVEGEPASRLPAIEYRTGPPDREEGPDSTA